MNNLAWKWETENEAVKYSVLHYKRGKPAENLVCIHTQTGLEKIES